MPSQAIQFQFSWLPSLGINAHIYIDALSALFLILIFGIGVLVLLYSHFYFHGEKGTVRFNGLLIAFMVAMAGLVMAGDLISLFVFWEITSVLSFLLIGTRINDASARAGALRSLLITGGGGICLLIGFLILGSIGGSYEIATLLTKRQTIVANPLYPLMFFFICLGAFTKSAQVPFHIWLPGAMSAPTPASAYLHSATMVKAGIYLLARLHPALGQTDSWFWTLSLIGLFTMLTGAYLGLKQTDLKALLAYSTISQLGALVMLLGQETSNAFKAVVIGILAHAFYKSALFLVVGIVDHEMGTRDIRRLGGLRRLMPGLAVIAGVSALSMAGFPPLFGFLAKETLLATVSHPSLPSFVNVVFPAVCVLTGAMLIAQADIFFLDTFCGKLKGDLSKKKNPKIPWGMWLAPAIPAVFSMFFAFFPEPDLIATFLASSASAAYGEKVKVSLALWTGISAPVVLSVIAVAMGMALAAYRRRVRTLIHHWPWKISIEEIFAKTISLFDQTAWVAVRMQHGKLRFYLMIMITGLGVAVAFWSGLKIQFHHPTFEINDAVDVARFLAHGFIIASAIGLLLVKTDMVAVIILAASSFGVAMVLALEPAPDVALVQILVDVLTTVLLLLILMRIPKQSVIFRGFTWGRVWAGIISCFAAGGVAILSLAALESRPRVSLVTPFYETNAKPLTGAADIVGAIVVDFRGYDTMIEIGVFAMAGLAVLSLLLFVLKPNSDKNMTMSSFPSVLNYLSAIFLPITMIFAVVHMMFGHNGPGDGFTAGLMVSLGYGFYTLVHGTKIAQEKLFWMKPLYLISAGLSLTLVRALTPLIFDAPFFSPFNILNNLSFLWPAGFSLSGSFLFEVAIALSVVGSMGAVIQSLTIKTDFLENKSL